MPSPPSPAPPAPTREAININPAPAADLDSLLAAGYACLLIGVTTGRLAGVYARVRYEWRSIEALMDNKRVEKCSDTVTAADPLRQHARREMRKFISARVRRVRGEKVRG